MQWNREGTILVIARIWLGSTETPAAPGTLPAIGLSEGCLPQVPSTLHSSGQDLAISLFHTAFLISI